MEDNKSPSALQGIRILDMALFGPGPFCATILGDLGAEIIKIHEPNATRRGGPILLQFPDSPTFPGLRNCKMIGLNLKSEAGRQIFHKLVKTADAFMESYRPGVMKRLGIDYDSLCKINPNIVYASLTGYGQEGPYRDVVGHDINYISVAGLLGMTGAAGGPPSLPGTLVADFAAGGMSTAIGILSALMARERTGIGQYVDVSMTDGVVSLMYERIHPYLTDGEESIRGDSMFTGHWPWYNVYETKDGKYISIGAYEPHFYANLCELLGCEQYTEHQWREGAIRKEILNFVKNKFLEKTRDEWFEILRQKDTCVAPVHTIEETVTDPQLLHRDTINELPHPRLGTVKQCGPLFKLSKTPPRLHNWCTSFGQHTEEVLLELGYNTSQIEEFRQDGVIN